MSSPWRAHAAAIIRDVIERVGTDDERALRQALRDAYPFGPRANHPYKIWCSEVRFQLGEKRRAALARVDSPGQRELFS